MVGRCEEQSMSIEPIQLKEDGLSERHECNEVYSLRSAIQR
jgi:hypothetical protein